MAIKINVIQHGRKALNGKWFGKTVSMGEVGTHELAQLVSHSNSVTESDVYGVIKALEKEMERLLKQGKTVVLEDIGRFHLTIKSAMVDDPDEYNVREHVREVCVKFTPAAHRRRDGTLERSFTAGTKVERL
ncbi:MAG: HU family DNA-binding protein [Prevotella sp.]|nr:HU family DNA-binding protein [Prevotella sp.]